MKALLYFVVCLLFVPMTSPAQAASAQNDMAFQRAKHLRRGINTCCWFAQSPDRYSKQRLESFTTEDDLTLIHQLGFDHIRLSIDAQPIIESQRGGDSVFMTELDRVVHAATALQLAVIIDIHPESSYKQALLQGSESVNRFASLWRTLASHFAQTDPELVFFEMMNEPEQTDPYRWMGIQSTVAAQIRSVAPSHTLIAAGAHWSGLEDLLITEPLPFGNVIYTFHDYDPFAFTHQGATWTSPQVEPLRQVPYPAGDASLKANMEQETTLAGQYFVEQYRLGHWDAQRIDATLAFAERWSKQPHVPVYVGEFGVHRPYADEGSRARWLHDMRVAMEAHHLGWAMWDYQDNFGLVRKSSGIAVVDRAVAAALGLNDIGVTGK
jgi:endoglucanase